MSKKQIAIIGAGAASALLLFGVIFTWIVASGSSYSPDKQLDFAMTLLDDGRWDLANRIARDIESEGELTPARELVWNYVRGVAGALSASDRLELPHARVSLWEASDFLEKSREGGFPIGYRGKGAYYLGFCYFQTYDWGNAIEALAPVVDGWPEKRSDALDMMIEACLRQTPPDRKRGEELLTQWASIPGLSNNERYQIQLKKAHIGFIDGDWSKCEKELASIPDNAPQASWAKLGRGRWRLENAAEVPDQDARKKELLSQALEEFRSVVMSPTTPAQARRQASYLTGVTLRRLGRLQEAISTLSAVRQRSPESAEAIAAGIEETEIQTDLGKYVDALETARHVIDDLGDVRLYDERWMPLATLRKRLLDVGQYLQEQDEFPYSIRLAGYLPPIFPAGDALRLEAETYKVWGAKLESEIPTATVQQRAELRRSADTKFSLAGDKYRELAKVELRSASYPNILWEAIEAYRKSHQLDRANELLHEYLSYEERSKRPRALLALGQNYLNEAQWDKALPPLERCLMEFPDHPTCYEVRLVIAQALAEKQQLEQAIEVLLKNLYDGNLQPDSKLWRDSLFELGQIIYRQGDQLTLNVELADNEEWEAKLDKLKVSHEEMLMAIDRLSEAVERFGTDNRSLEARYAIGRAYRTASMFPQQMLDSGLVSIEASRRQLVQERRQLLNSALEGYKDLRTALGDAQEHAMLSESGQALLRNCYFGEADVLFELERYDEAIQAYRNVGNRFMNEPEALEALMQISECYRKLGQDVQARRTLNQAEQLLGRIPPEQDGRFPVVTRADRAGWQQMLAWLKKT